MEVVVETNIQKTLGVVCERYKTRRGRWNSAVVIRRKDWGESARITTIKDDVIASFLRSVDDLIPVLESGRLNRYTGRVPVRGSGGNGLALTMYGPPGKVQWRYGALPIKGDSVDLRKSNLSATTDIFD